MRKKSRVFSFMPTYGSITEVLTDHSLASLGDAYVNFACSLALSNRKGKPLGAKVKGGLLAEAFRRAGLRKHAPSRMSTHELADAAEALMVYAWLHDYVTLEEAVGILEGAGASVEGLSLLLTEIKTRIRFS